MLIQIAGLFLGVFLRTFLPYIRKLKQGHIEKFEKKFLYQAIGAIILSFISVILIIPQFEFKTEGINFIEGLKNFSIAFSFGFAWNSLINEGRKWKK